MMLSMAPWFSASAVIPQLRDDWGLSTGAASLLIIAVQLGFVAGAVISAGFSLADVVPPRRLMLLGTLGAAAANGALVLVEGPEAAVALRSEDRVLLHRLLELLTAQQSWDDTLRVMLRIAALAIAKNRHPAAAKKSGAVSPWSAP